MGQSPAQETLNIQSSFNTHHSPLNLPSTIRLIKQTQLSPTVIEYSMVTTDKEICQKWASSLKEYFRDVDTTWFYLPIKYHFQEDSICGSAGKIDILYELYPYDLNWVISQRASQKQPFLNSEMWKLLYVLCCAGEALHEKGKGLGKICSEFVFFNSDCSSIKVGMGLSFLSDMVVNQIVAPDATSHFKRHKDESIYQQSFSIGLLVLCTICLIPTSKIKNIKSIECIQILLKQIQKNFNYDKKLIQVLTKMCNPIPQMRILATQIVNTLFILEEDIMNNFQITEQSVDIILKQNQQKMHKNLKRLSVTIGLSYIQDQSVKNIQKDEQYSQQLKKKIQQTHSQYVSCKTSSRKSKSRKKKNYNSFLAMVDEQLETSRKSYRQ